MSAERNDQSTLFPIAVSEERKLRMVVLGASRSGKTQIMSQFMGKGFSDIYIPSMEEYHRKIYTIKGRTYQLDILETSGMSSNAINQKITLMSGDIFLIVYSITDANSFESAKATAKLVERAKLAQASEAQQHSNNLRHWNCRKKSMWSVPITLAGNKSDLVDERAVSADDVADWMQSGQQSLVKTRRAHVNVSAKDPVSVQRLFEKVFSTANLPIEMSPNMHRKVSTSAFLENASKGHARQRDDPSRSHSEHDGKLKRFVKQHSPISAHRTLAAESSSSNSSSSDDISLPHNAGEPDEISDAFAIDCPNLRRPSTATEVSIVMDKTKHHSHYISRETFAPLLKLRKSLSRVSSSHI